MKVQLFTIGFTQKTAEEFFTILREAGIKRVLDIRLINNSSLAGFTRSTHLPFFLRELCDADHLHLSQCAPTKEILEAYQKKELPWDKYEEKFLPLIRERRIQDILTPELLDFGCLLCCEPLPDKCHRRLVAEYMHEHVEGLNITHL